MSWEVCKRLRSSAWVLAGGASKHNDLTGSGFSHLEVPKQTIHTDKCGISWNRMGLLQMYQIKNCQSRSAFSYRSQTISQQPTAPSSYTVHRCQNKQHRIAFGMERERKCLDWMRHKPLIFTKVFLG